MSIQTATANAALSSTGGLGYAAEGALIGAIKDKDKGSLGNRTNYLAKQTKENFKAALKTDAVVIGGTAATAGATALVTKSSTVQNALKNGFTKIASSSFGTKLKNAVAELAPYASKAVSAFKALPTPAKAVLVAGSVITTLAAQKIFNNHLVRSGQIDQEYTDKAKMEKTLA